MDRDEGRILLDAVIRAPDDDAPRLAYAGWLEKQGEPERGEFIRVQCALDAMPADDPRRPSLRAREDELLGMYGWTWAEELGTDVSEWVYRRGFIEQVEMSLERPADPILAVLNKAPIRHVRDSRQFCDLDGVVGALPHLDRLTGLEFWALYAFKDQLIAALLESPHLRNLRTLILHHDRNGNLVEDRVLIKGLASPHRSNLRELAVNVDGSWRGPSPEVLLALVQSPYLSNLRKLNLSYTKLDVTLVQFLGHSPAFTNLESLDLGGCRLTSRVWDAIAQLPQLRRLNWLRLSDAAQVDERDRPVGYLKEIPTYRGAFEDRAATVDWDTPFVTPRDRNAGWQGLTWEERQRRPLLAMERFLRVGDYAGLEAEYRRSCEELAGAEIRAEIDSLPFARYEERLHQGFRQSVAVLPKKRGEAIYLRIRPDIEWMGDFHVQAKDDPTAPVPREEFSHEGPIAEFKAPDFPEAARIYAAHPLHAGTRPGGAALYLLARTVAAFGRCRSQYDVPSPVYFSCMYAVFRMENGRR